MTLAMYADFVVAIFFTFVLLCMVAYICAKGYGYKFSDDVAEEDLTEIKKLLHYIAVRNGYIETLESDNEEEKKQ